VGGYSVQLQCPKLGTSGVIPEGVTTATPLPEVSNIERWAFTFYSCQPKEGFCETTYSGTSVGVGRHVGILDAACGWDVPLGTVVTIIKTGESYTCTDRGKLGVRHIDVWFYYEGTGWIWQSWVGSSGLVRIDLP
jgi:3D (Asp-Asp-Asp) domain-containing protein